MNLLLFLFYGMLFYTFWDLLKYIKNYDGDNTKEFKRKFNKVAFNVFVITVVIMVTNIKRMYYPTISSFILNNLALLSIAVVNGVFTLVPLFLLKFHDFDDSE